MLRIPLALAALFLLLAATPTPAAGSTSGVVVSELRLRGPAGASDEFVELVNAGPEPVDVSGWRVQACSATTGTAATRATVPAGTTLAPGQHLLAAHATGYTGPAAADLTYATGIADGGGARVVTADGAYVDGAASTAAATSECREGTGLTFPTTDSPTSLERLGGTQDTDDNAADFAAAASDPENLASVPPTVSVADVAVAEGEDALFAVELSRPSVRAVTVDVTTADGTARAPDDYAAVSATVTVAPGEVRALFTVATVADGLDEPDETFAVTLSGATRAVVADASAEATIVDGDEEPTVSVAGTAVAEGAVASFTVSLSAPSSFPVSVTYATVDDTATAPDDYTAAVGTVVLAPGETTATIEVATVADAVDEPDETFALELGDPRHATLGAGRAEATIVDDDEPDVGQPGGDDPGTPGTLAAAGRVEGAGALLACVRLHPGDAAARGRVVYVARGVRFASTSITTLIVRPDAAAVTGTALVAGRMQPFELRVEGRTVTLSWPGHSTSGRLRGLLALRPA